MFDEEFVGFNNGTYGRLLSQSFTWLQGSFITAQSPLAPPSQPALQGKVDLGSTALARFRMSLPKKAAAAFLGQNPMFTSQMDAQAVPSSASLLGAESLHILAKTGTGKHCSHFAKPLPSAGFYCLLQLPSSKHVRPARWARVTCGSCCTGQEALLKFCNTHAFLLCPMHDTLAPTQSGSVCRQNLMVSWAKLARSAEAECVEKLEVLPCRQPEHVRCKLAWNPSQQLPTV